MNKPLEKSPWPDDRAREDWRLRLAILKEKAAYRQFWRDNIDNVKKAHTDIQAFYSRLPNAGRNGLTTEQFNQIQDECETAFKTLRQFNSFLWNYCGIRPPAVNHEAVLGALDPRNDIPEKLPFSFKEPPPVVMVELDKKPPLFEGRSNIPLNYAIENLKPSERLLKIDLSRKRGELIKEFETFLNAVEYLRKTEGHLHENYQAWNPDNTRYRAETWKALEVWRLIHWQRKTYPEISKALNMSESAAKMAYRRAFELIEGRPYENEKHKREYAEIRKPELKKTCDNCPNHPKNGGQCSELCPDVLYFVNQDEIKQRELPIEILI